jgi:predicted urease superfamily metal-dependent hydrolase
MDLASRGISFVAKYANEIFSAIDKFKKNHPILYKIIVAIMIAVIIYALFGSSNAQAAVKVGNVQIDDTTYSAMQGALNEAGRDPDFAMAIGKAQVALERAHQANETINVKDLAPTIQEAFKVVDSTLNQAASGNPTAGKLFSKWIQVGEKLRFSATGF